jgi:hypothetical protein
VAKLRGSKVDVTVGIVLMDKTAYGFRQLLKYQKTKRKQHKDDYYRYLCHEGEPLIDTKQYDG